MINILPKDQIERVLNQKYCDIDLNFLGFTDIYENLSKIIPKHFTVIDLGCAYNPQCFYFTEHKQFVAVDISECEKFKSDNCLIFQKSIEDFILENIKDYNLDETFAICSYVPPWGGDNREMARKAFKNIFVYYPHGGYKINLEKNKK
jgi:hypothetical protein